MGNSCGTCKHEDLSTHQSPCKECGGIRVCWEAKPNGRSRVPMTSGVGTTREIDMDTRTGALLLVDMERNRQDIKWGEQNHAPQLWVGILGEEFGEYCQAVNETVFSNGEVARAKGGYDNMMTELTHVAAVAVGAMESLMRNKEVQS